MSTKGVNVFNYIRQEVPNQAFRDNVPAATENNISDLANILLDSAYQPMLNEFVTTLINRIGLTMIKNKSFDNPLAMLKKGAVPLGTDVQDIYTNPATAEEYEYSDSAMAKLLKINNPDTHAAYYRRNRQDIYTKTITREGLQGAFVSWTEFENFITSIVNSLYSGAYIDEFKDTKALIDGAYSNDKVITESVSRPVDETTAKAFLTKVRALYNKMKYPSSEYNAYTKFTETENSIVTWTEPERTLFITTADIMAVVDVEALAAAFNMDRANFLGRVVEVDSFENPEILGLICDESFFQIYDQIFRFDEFYNARTMSWQEYLHVWEIFAICPFANAVMLIDGNPTPPTPTSELKASDFKLISAEFVADNNVNADAGAILEYTGNVDLSDYTIHASMSSPAFAVEDYVSGYTTDYEEVEEHKAIVITAIAAADPSSTAVTDEDGLVILSLSKDGEQLMFTYPALMSAANGGD